MTERSYDRMRAESAHFWPANFPVLLKYNPAAQIDLNCEKAIADDSLDHIEPRGTAQDNTHWLPFIARCEAHYGFRDLRYLDLGCAGGGLVFDFAVRRHFAMGLEGSDYSFLARRAEWATIPNNLFTCDITRNFRITEKNSDTPFNFDVIGIWDALEHLAADRLPTFFDNVQAHLAADGLFCGTVSTRGAAKSESGRNHHEIVQPRSWWNEQFSRHDFEHVREEVFALSEFPRGNGIVFPANFGTHPNDGFHFVLKARRSLAR